MPRPPSLQPLLAASPGRFSSCFKTSWWDAYNLSNKFTAGSPGPQVSIPCMVNLYSLPHGGAFSSCAVHRVCWKWILSDFKSKCIFKQLNRLYKWGSSPCRGNLFLSPNLALSVITPSSEGPQKRMQNEWAIRHSSTSPLRRCTAAALLQRLH